MAFVCWIITNRLEVASFLTFSVPQVWLLRWSQWPRFLELRAPATRNIHKEQSHLGSEKKRSRNQNYEFIVFQISIQNSHQENDEIRCGSNKYRILSDHKGSLLSTILRLDIVWCYIVWCYFVTTQDPWHKTMSDCPPDFCVNCKLAFYASFEMEGWECR